MIRLLIVILILIYHKEIYNFLVSKKLNNIEGLSHNLKKKEKKLHRFIQEGNLNDILRIIESIDKNTYNECKIILKSIRKIRSNIIKSLQKNKILKSGYLENEFDNIKFEKKKILNLVTSLYVNFTNIKDHNNLVSSIEKYINRVLLEISEAAHKSKIVRNIEIFENFDKIEPYDNNINFNYDIY
tara:strand:- start:597 stop:1151 length:555 start_codon:yes stop_codon:yes gene_type:complete